MQPMRWCNRVSPIEIPSTCCCSIWEHQEYQSPTLGGICGKQLTFRAAFETNIRDVNNCWCATMRYLKSDAYGNRLPQSATRYYSRFVFVGIMHRNLLQLGGPRSLV